MHISKESYIINVGVRIRQLRERLNMSQEDLAVDCNISKRQIGRIERGETNVSLGTLILISNALDIEPKCLLDFTIKQ